MIAVCRVVGRSWRTAKNRSSGSWSGRSLRGRQQNFPAAVGRHRRLRFQIHVVRRSSHDTVEGQFQAVNREPYGREGSANSFSQKVEAAHASTQPVEGQGAGGIPVEVQWEDEV